MGRNNTIFLDYGDVYVNDGDHEYRYYSTVRITRNAYDVYNTQYSSLIVQFRSGYILLDETKKLNLKL